MEVKKINEMTDEEFEFWTEHGHEVRLLEDAEDADAQFEALARPDYGQSLLREPLWSEVVEGLWQGGTGDHDIMQQPKFPVITRKTFDTVITLYQFANPVDWHVKELRYGVWDGNAQDIDLKELFDLVKMAHTDWVNGKKVLIRCQAGWNRSGLVTALVLMRDGMEAHEAIDLIREKRSPHALCNKNFVEFLLNTNPLDWCGDRYQDTPRKKKKN